MSERIHCSVAGEGARVFLMTMEAALLREG